MTVAAVVVFAVMAQVAEAASWKVQSTPNPTGAKSSQLSGVSCYSANACTAVGQYTNSGGTTLHLVEAWNGSGWKVEGVPNPSGAQSSQLSGVSCTSASACTAVGNYTDSAGTEVTLAERYS